ncbi:MAG: vanadium-dependent haloperoxidase, partial [Candidatus Methylumidiphilus sp.]
MNNKIKTLFQSAVALYFVFTGATHADTLVTDWDAVTLKAIRDTRPGPPMVARALAITHTAIFDAWAAYDGRAVGTRLGATLRRPSNERTDTNKKIAISYAAYRALVDLFPTQKAKFDAKLSELGYDPANASTDTSTAVGIGNVAAAALLEYRHHDGSNQLGDLSASHIPYSDYTGYAPVNTPDAIIDPSRWQPLRVSDGHGGTVVQTFIAPHWSKVVPFSLTSSDQFRPGPPAATSSAAFRAQADQIVQYTHCLDDHQKVIAEYWADGPSSELPPGHWALFATFVSNRDKHTLDDDAKMFFAMTNAVFDAGIVAWEAKRFYDYVRPVTAIHYLYAGQTLPYYDGQVVAAEAWQPYQVPTLVTPAFAEYISGHSIFSRAAAEVLRNFTGSDTFGNQTTIPAGSSRVQPGTVPAHDVTLYWATFTEAAD